MSVHVRRAGLEDVDIAAPLFDAYRQFYRQAPDLPLARDFLAERLRLQQSAVFLAAAEDGVTAGFMQLYPLFSSASAARIWLLNDLFVAPAARGKKLGYALLQAAREFAIADGAVRLELSTAHDNPAQKLYESVGYEKDREFLYYSLPLGAKA